MRSQPDSVKPPSLELPLFSLQQAADVWPPVSVILPCRNERAFIELSIRSILGQDYPGFIEILVIDGISDDGTRPIIQHLVETTQTMTGGQHSSSPHGARRMILLNNPHKAVPFALNLALSHASGEVIFRLDGHSQMASDYVRVCVRTLHDHPEVACVGGPSVAVGNGILGGAYALALRSPFGVGGGTFRTCRAEAFVDTLAFGGYRKHIFSQIGAFDLDLHRNQDIRFSAALRKAGHRQLLIPATHTLYHPPQTLAGIIKQNFWNGYWNTRVLHKMIGVLSWRHFIPLAFVAAVLGSILIASVSAWGGIALGLIGGTYLAASLVASLARNLWATRHRRWLLPLIFPLMHLCYGWGSLVGLFRFLVYGPPKVKM
jgi:succinoglycan biosynthesis protein ExoA